MIWLSLSTIQSQLGIGLAITEKFKCENFFSIAADNPAVNTEYTGKLDSEDVVDIFNGEQKDDEEIVVDVNDLADGVKLPPNTAHNLDKSRVRNDWTLMTVI